MLMIEPTTAVRFSAGSFDPTSSRRLSHSGSFSVAWRKFQRSADASHVRSDNYAKYRKIRASAEEQLGAGSSPLKPNPKPSRYHPFEEVSEPELVEGGEARLTPAETTRTIIEVNSKATLMFSGLLGEEVHENIFWPDLPYVTDEHANIYFQVKNDEDILRTLTAEDNYVQVIIGLDTAELVRELEVSGPIALDFGIHEIDDEDSDDEDEDGDDDDVDDNEDDEDEDYDEEWVSGLEDDEDEEDDDESLGDWAKLDTMRTSHPMYFAKKLTEVVTDDPVDCMNQPPDGLAIQGLLRPALIEEHSVIQKHITDLNSGTSDLKQIGIHDEDKVENLGIINGHRQLSEDSSISAEELEKGGSFRNGTSFYKLEMIKIQLITSDVHQTVEVQDLRKAKPDAIAHSAANIISRLKAGGEKTMQALQSLCWRCKGIQVEEASIIGVDSLGFDLRISSGTQLQTLRFTFHARASSEYSAERQLNDLLFPRTHHNPQKKRETRQTEL